MHKKNSRIVAAAILAITTLSLGLVEILNTGSAHAQASFVQVGTNRIASGSSVGVTLAQAVTANDLLIAYTLSASGSTNTLTDTFGDTFTEVSSPVIWESGARSATVFYAIAKSSGNDTVTANFSPATTSSGLLYINEYSGVSATLDGTSSAIGTGSAMNSGNIATTNSTDLLVSFGVSDNAVTSVGSGWVVRSNFRLNTDMDKTVSTAGIYSATATQNSNAWALQIVAFQALSNGTTTTTTGATSSTSSTLATTSTTQATTTTTQPITTTTIPSGGGITSPLRVSSTNSHYLMDGNGRAVYLAGSHTWDDMQDLGLVPNTPPAFDFNAYVNFLVAHGQNMTILWRKDLPTFCNWGAGGTWHASQFPWPRTGPGTASDGLPAFDLSQFDQSYFDRLRSRVVQLLQNNIYATVQLFDGLQLLNNRCSNDGYPFSGGNNVNGVSDGGGTGSMTMGSPNAITNFQDAFVKKTIDTLNDLPNVLWEISEEAPNNSTWWQNHMISLIHSYEATKPAQHPVGYPWLTGGSNGTLYASAADWVAPNSRISATSNSGNKAIVNDSDHSYYGMWNDSAQTNRNYLWENFANGASVIFMDPYEIYWTSGNRNLCPNPVNGVCSGPSSRWDNFRNNLGYAVALANKMNLAAMTPHSGHTSTGYALANLGSEYMVYAPNGGSFTVDLSGISRSFKVEWLNPSTGAITSAGTVNGGATAQSFTPPFGGDAVLHLS